MSNRRKAILLNDTSGEQHVGCSLVIDNLRRICRDHEIDVIETFTRKDLLSNDVRNRVFSPSIDLIIVNGEGTLHHSPRATSGLLHLKTDKPKILVNTVWESMYCCSDLLKNFKFISVRESYSYREICKSVDGKKVEVIPDLIFYDPNKLRNIDSIGYSDSVMTHVCGELKKKENFFAMQNMHKFSIGAYISWMKSLDLFVTGRFHGVCLAILLNVPFLTFPSNSHKIEGILGDCNCSELLISDFLEVEEKKDLAFKALEKTKVYADNAHKKIAMFYDKVFKRIK